MGLFCQAEGYRQVSAGQFLKTWLDAEQLVMKERHEVRE